MNELETDFKNSRCFRRARITEALFLLTILIASVSWFVYKIKMDIILSFFGLILSIVLFLMIFYQVHKNEDCPSAAGVFSHLPVRGFIAAIAFGFSFSFGYGFNDLLVLLVSLFLIAVLCTALFAPNRWDTLQDEINEKVNEERESE